MGCNYLSLPFIPVSDTVLIWLIQLGLIIAWSVIAWWWLHIRVMSPWWATWHFKSLATRLFDPQLTSADNKGNINPTLYWPFVKGNHQWIPLTKFYFHGCYFICYIRYHIGASYHETQLYVQQLERNSSKILIGSSDEWTWQVCHIQFSSCQSP